ncbi:MAG: LCP family protein [Pseudanabaenaceae cyanobacterium]
MLNYSKFTNFYKNFVMLSPLSVAPNKKDLPLGKICLGLAVTGAVAIGMLLGRYAPLTAFDWLGLLRGRSPTEVLIEGMASRLEQPYQILVMGIDRVPRDPASFDGRSDTILLIRLDPVAKKVTILSIPRDTLVQIRGYGGQKVNAANVFGGVELAKTVISETFNHVQIDRYARLDTNSIVDLVDAVGGIEINVPERMYYIDRTQNLVIDLQPGVQILNGKQAEGFVRYRGPIHGDIGRIQRQQIMLRALKAKLANPLIVTKLPDLIGVVQKHLNTDLNFDEMLAIASFALSLSPHQVEMLTLPGRPSEVGEFVASYWITTPEEIDTVIDGKFVVTEPPKENY